MTSPISRDPNEPPQVSQDMMDYVKSIGWVIVVVTCEIPETEDAERETFSFAAVMPTVPRVNEHIALENGGLCRVQQVLYRAVTRDGIIPMQPDVYAVIDGQVQLRN